MSEYLKKLRPRVTLEATKRLSSSSELKRVIKKSKIKVETIKKKDKRKKTGKKYQKLSAHPTLLSTSSYEQVDPMLSVPKPFEESKGEMTEMKVKRCKYKRTKTDVHEFLRRVGVGDFDSACLCLKAGIKNKCVNIDGPNPLENTILKSKCYLCEAEVTVKLEDVLYQGATGGSYWGGSDTDLHCPNPECDEQFVVSGMCSPYPELSDGKFYNHCGLCPGFGECIGDYRESHCTSCGKHYFAGSMDQFKCSTCYSSDEDDDAFGRNMMFPGAGASSISNSIFSYLYKELDSTRFDAFDLLDDSSQIDLGRAHFVLKNDDSSDTDQETEKMTCD